MRNIKAVIFDMDGLLLDTEKISESTFLQATREYGIESDIRVYHNCIGTTSARTREILMEGYGPDFPYNEIRELWRQKYYDAAIDRPVPLKEGVLSLLKYLENSQTRRAVVTSTEQANAFKMLANAGILNYFEFVLGGDQVAHGKPSPEIYIAACRKLGLEPSVCLALEDSDNGVLSAYYAGLHVIQVPDIKGPSDKVQALGHIVVNSLLDVKKILESN